MRRDLVTIGDLRGRSRYERRRASMRFLGQVSADLQIAAENLLAFFGAHAPDQGLNNGVVAAFQTQWNVTPLAGSGIDVDDEYGPNTQVALAITLRDYGNPSVAPPNAFSTVLPAVPGRGKPVGPAPGPGPAPIVPSGGGGGEGSWVLPALLIGGGATLLYFLFRKKKGSRQPTVEIRHNPRGRRSSARALLA